MRAYLFAAVAGLSIVLSGATALAADEPRQITAVEGITEHQLANGMRVLLFPEASKPTVTVNITFFVGSRHEGYGETGMAHLLEHMVFKGTPKHPQIWKALQDHGANFNGTTWFDRTNYFETLAATDENLEFALAMEADRMVNSRIAGEDLAKEFSVVRNEFESGENNPLSVLSDRMMSTAFLWHNYGKSTIGSREDIERVPIHRLQAFYKKFYQPDNAMLVVAGKFDAAKTLARINELFGSCPRPDRKLDPTYTVEPVQDGEREVVLRRVGDVQAVGCVYHVPAGSHEDFAAVEVLEHALTADQTGRLYRALVEPQLATRVRGSAYQLAEPGMLEFIAEVRRDKSLDEVRKVLLSTLDTQGGGDFTNEEVERAKNAMAKDFDLLANDPGRLGIRLSEFAAMGDWRLMFLHRDRIAKVTPGDVRRVAAAYLRPSNRTIGTFLPEASPTRATIPAIPDIASALRDYKGREAVAAGETLDATPDALEARAQRVATPYGMKLVMLPKKTRGNKVNFVLNLRYGSEKSLAGQTAAASFLSSMLMSGTSKHTKRQIADEFDKLKAEVSFGGGGGRMRGMMAGATGAPPGILSVSVETTRKNLPAVMELLAECLRDSTFPEKEFEKARKQSLSGIEQMVSEPIPLAMVEYRRRLMPLATEDPRATLTFGERMERIKKVDLAKLRALYQEMVGAGSAELAIVGDFDASEVRTLVDSLFASWKGRTAFERLAMPYFETKGDALAIETPDKANAFILLGMCMPIRDDDPDYPALFMANYILGGNSNSRLLNRLRQKEGFSYGTGSSLTTSAHEKAAVFSSYAICNPVNADKAVAAAREEIAKLVKEGVQPTELADAQKGYAEDFRVNLSSDAAVCGMFAQQAFTGRTMKFTQDQLAAIAGLTVEQVNAAARKYIQPDRLIVVKAGDFKAAPAK